MRLAIIMDPLESLQFDHDTTYVMMCEACRRGFSVYHVAPSGVAYEGSEAVLFGRPVRTTLKPDHPFEIGPWRRLSGIDLDAVLIRTDPPFNPDYLSVTLLLDLLPPRVVILNRPSGLRDANEKLVALRYPDLCPPTCVSQSPTVLETFRLKVGGTMVVKPLDGFGGRGVLLVREDDPNRDALLRVVTQNGTVKALAQALVPEADQGDRRVLLLDGEPIGAVLRRNDQGQFTHNLATGGTAHPWTLNEVDRRVSARIAPWLNEQGLWLVGVDLIGDKLIEINVTSPTCVQEINRLEGIALERRILDSLEARVARHASGS